MGAQASIRHEHHICQSPTAGANIIVSMNFRNHPVSLRESRLLIANFMHRAYKLDIIEHPALEGESEKVSLYQSAWN